MVTGRKSETEKYVTEQYHILKKKEVFNGFEKSYFPYDELNGEKLAKEQLKVQFDANTLINQASEKWIELWDLIATQDYANQTAHADVVVDGKIVIGNVPVTTLLFLEKQVNDLETFVSYLPTPDISETWTFDPNIGMLRSAQSESLRTKKVPGHYTKAEATKEHPAQVEFFYQDVPVGKWIKTNFSSAIPADAKILMLSRLKKLKEAIKLAREEANLLEVNMQKIGKPLIDFVFSK